MGNLRTKVAKGIAFGDVSNVAIRNILTEISKEFYGELTDKDMEASLNFFNGRCPYTGRYLLDDIKNNKNTYAIDHIVPQNKNECGLNIKGNLVFVDKTANNAKAGKSVEEFLLNDQTVLCGIDIITRRERLDKIHLYQKENNYNPTLLKSKISPILLSYYQVLQQEQKKLIDKVKEEIRRNNLIEKKIEQKNEFISKSIRYQNGTSLIKVGEIVKQRLIPCLVKNITQEEARQFCDIGFSKQVFNLSGFSLLVEELNFQNNKRYYKNPVYIDKKKYYVCSQWYERNRSYIISWLKKYNYETSSVSCVNTPKECLKENNDNYWKKVNWDKVITERTSEERDLNRYGFYDPFDNIKD